MSDDVQRAPRKKRAVTRIDVLASVASRVLPGFLTPAVDQVRCDVQTVVDELGGMRAPVFSNSSAPLRSPHPLQEIDPVEHLLPRGVLRRSWVLLRGDLKWLVRDFTEGSRPPLIKRSEARAGARNRAAGIRTKRVRVSALQRETPDALTIAFSSVLGAPLRFTPGQFFTLLLTIEGESLKRAYSVSSSEATGEVSVTVKRVEGGIASNWLNDHLSVGDEFEVLGPSGNFISPATGAHHLVMFAGGSGITPIASIAESVLSQRVDQQVTLFFGNRGFEDIIFRERLERLRETYSDRFQLHFVLEEPSDACASRIGQLGGEMAASLLDDMPEDDLPRTYFICGPAPMKTAVHACLWERGVSASAIKIESFLPQRAKRLPTLPSEPVNLDVLVGGEVHTVSVEPGATILETATESGIEMPFSCAMGGCAACKCRLVSGSVVMDEPNCLSSEERDEGWILTCVSRPSSPCRLEVVS